MRDEKKNERVEDGSMERHERGTGEALKTTRAARAAKTN
jgi:hypothetical protein